MLITIFSRKKKFLKNKARKILKLNKDSFVIGYVGSINKVYLIKKMILFIENLKKKKKFNVYICNYSNK